MADCVNYSQLLTRCLAVEDKAHRDAVLAKYSPQVRAIMQSQMQGIAKRLANHIYFADDREQSLSREQRRELRRRRLAAIREPWLRDRVEAMVREMFEQARKGRGATG